MVILWFRVHSTHCPVELRQIANIITLQCLSMCITVLSLLHWLTRETNDDLSQEVNNQSAGP